MCTLTAIQPERRADDVPLFRVVVNRDEQRTRAEALPPRVARAGDHDAIYPIDPVSRGTWVGVNTAGLVVAILNSNPIARPTNRPGLRSRGEIVPALLACSSVTAALAAASDIPAHEFPPFRLVAIERDRFVVVLGDSQRTTVQALRRFDAPFLATSSGLGDHIVEQPRRELFNAMLVRGVSDIADRQDAFHRHRWPDRHHVSVEMSRGDARTVSRTVVEVFHDSVRLTYRPLQEIDARTPMDGHDSHAEASRRRHPSMPLTRFASSLSR
jgi:hypothetical protein